MKKILIFCCFLFGLVNLAFGQEDNTATKLIAKKAAIRQNGEWSDWKECNILTVLKKGKIIIYSERTQKYNEISFSQKTSAEGDTYGSAFCVDDYGDECTVDLYTYENGKVQIYIWYPKIAWTYILVDDE